MIALFVRGLIRLLGSLPLRLNQIIGAAFGWLAFHSKGKLHGIAMINVRLCYPTLSDGEHLALVKSSLIETGKSFTEAAWLWTQPQAKIAARTFQGEGYEIYQQYAEESKGLLVATPHWGAWELCTYPLSQSRALTYMYREPRLKGLNEPLIQWRANLGGEPAMLDAGGIRKVLKALKQGRTIGLLPDQEPDRENGVFAPFFDVPANTMTLMSKFLSRTDANVMVCLAERRPRAEGWTIRYLKAEEGVGSTDKIVAATAVNKTVERCIAIDPAQYNWSYKRFRRLPNGDKRNYSLK